MKKFPGFRRSGKENETRRLTLVQSAKISHISASSLLFLLGLLLIVLPDSIGEKAVFPYLLGVISILVGATKILGFFSNDMYRLAFQFDFAYGIFTAVLGILLIARPERMFEKFVTIFCLYVIFDGLFKVQMSLDARQFGMKWQSVLCTGIVLTVIGLIAFIYPFEDAAYFTENNLVGILLMADTAESIWITAYTVRVRAHKKNFSERFGDIDF